MQESYRNTPHKIRLSNHLPFLTPLCPSGAPLSVFRAVVLFCLPSSPPPHCPSYLCVVHRYLQGVPLSGDVILPPPPQTPVPLCVIHLGCSVPLSGEGHDAIPPPPPPQTPVPLHRPSRPAACPSQRWGPWCDPADSAPPPAGWPGHVTVSLPFLLPLPAAPASSPALPTAGPPPQPSQVKIRLFLK